jgi:hypothetical protein
MPQEGPAHAVDDATVTDRDTGVTEQEDIIWLPDQRLFTLGRSRACLVRINNKTVSGQHCAFERRSSGLWVQDTKSLGGTFVNGSRIEGLVQLRSGSVLRVGDVTMIAFGEHEERRRGRDEIEREHLIGENPKFRTAVDQAMRGALENRGVVLEAEHGAGRTTIAEAIHRVYVGERPDRKFRPFSCGAPEFRIPVRSTSLTKRIGYSYGVIYVHEISTLEAQERRNLVQVLMRATDERALRFVISMAHPVTLHDIDPAVPVVRIPPLRERGADVGLLIDHFLREDVPGMSHADLPQKIQLALHSYDWPRNVTELRHTMTRLAAIAKYGTVTDAASSLDISRAAFQEWMNRRDIPYNLLVR